MKNNKKSIDPSWDFLTQKEINTFINIHARIWLKSELARGGYWGVREAKKLAFDAEKAKWKFFNNIYKTRPWFNNKDLRIEIYEGKVYAITRPMGLAELSGMYATKN